MRPSWSQEAYAVREAVRRAIDKAKRATVRWARINIPAGVSAEFGRERYADAQGNLQPLKPYSPEWGRYKMRRSLDMRRGHGTRGISKALGNKASIVETRTGFAYDPRVPARRLVARYPRRKPVPVIEYLDYYNDAKAGSLGSLSREQRKELQRVLERELDKALRPIRQSLNRLPRPIAREIIAAAGVRIVVR